MKLLLALVAVLSFLQYSHGEGQVEVARRLKLLASITSKIGSQGVEEFHGDHKRSPWYGEHQTLNVSNAVGDDKDEMMMFVVSSKLRTSSGTLLQDQTGIGNY